MSLKTGIVGCGKVGDFHAKAYSQLGSSAFAAVCDADLDRARAFAERYHVRAYADVAEMIQTEGLDVVSNSQNPALYGKVHIFGENGAGVGVQTDGGAMFIAGMSAIAEPPCNDLWTVPGEADLLEGWKQADCDFFNRVDTTTASRSRTSCARWRPTPAPWWTQGTAAGRWSCSPPSTAAPGPMRSSASPSPESAQRSCYENVLQ